jgi:hypothetical protein
MDYFRHSVFGRRFLLRNCTRRRFLRHRRLLIAHFLAPSFYLGGDLDDRCWSEPGGNEWFDQRRGAACPFDQPAKEKAHAASISR